MSNYTYMSDSSSIIIFVMKMRNNEDECIICFEQCNDQLHIFVKIVIINFMCIVF